MECNESVRTSGFNKMKETEKSNGKKEKRTKPIKTHMKRIGKMELN